MKRAYRNAKAWFCSYIYANPPTADLPHVIWTKASVMPSITPTPAPLNSRKARQRSVFNRGGLLAPYYFTPTWSACSIFGSRHPRCRQYFNNYLLYLSCQSDMLPSIVQCIPFTLYICGNSFPIDNLVLLLHSHVLQNWNKIGTLSTCYRYCTGAIPSQVTRPTTARRITTASPMEIVPSGLGS